LLSGQENESRRRSVAFLQHLTKNFYKDEGDQFKGRDLLKMIETPSEDLLAAIKNEGLSEVDAPWVDQFRQQTEKIFSCDVPPEKQITRPFVKFPQHCVSKEMRKQIMINEASSAKILRKFDRNNASKITMMDEREIMVS